MQAKKQQIYTFLAAFIFTPVFIVLFLFIPILGQLMGFLALLLSILYLWAKRSQILSAFLGVSTFCLLVMEVGHYNFAWYDLVLFVLLGFGIPIGVIYLLGMGYLVWREYAQNEKFQHQIKNL